MSYIPQSSFNCRYASASHPELGASRTWRKNKKKTQQAPALDAERDTTLAGSLPPGGALLLEYFSKNLVGFLPRISGAAGISIQKRGVDGFLPALFFSLCGWLCGEGTIFY